MMSLSYTHIFGRVAVQQAGNSGPLESLPETHSLASEPTNIAVPVPVERAKSVTGIKREDSDPPCRIPLFRSANSK